MPDHDEYYFAYGSNLNKEEAEQRGYKLDNDDLRFVSCAQLPDYELKFNRCSKNRGGGVLDVVKARGSIVSGAVFQVRDAEIWTQLDKKEGAPTAYQRVRLPVLLESGETLGVATYEVVKKSNKHIKPTEDYVNCVRDGLKKYGIPHDNFDRVVGRESGACRLDAVFVYGTLMRKESRAGLIAKHSPECVLLSQVRGSLINCGKYPGLIRVGAEDGGFTQGEFCRVADIESLLSELDEVEGFSSYFAGDNLFNRRVVKVEMLDGRVRTAWVYCWSGQFDELPLITSGDWRKEKGTRNEILELIASEHAKASGKNNQQEIYEALKNNELSERQLAQESGLWVAGVV